ncbi:hypothetical protein NDR87_33220 [Nocardia sp. CDC159]|uniref:Uncharacterized protein n=1 Tax=Nocardia pulmonis TaxID=2951408 RepID=A0A9X2J101_9NOCA|nr:MULTISPECIES: hypothetical protein [Nocardia]MCM6778359.1 hypothetical protein [Nocardia pulmonis]MCM6791245.1 hypothetical protein [Nocardia sp. CDC159]
MSDVSDLAALVAALRDEDLLAVVVTATTGRPGLERLHLVAVELSAHAGHATLEPDVSSATGVSNLSAPEPSVPTSGQVAPGSGIPVPPTGIGGAGEYTSGGVPTFESVRDKVEQRFGTAQGMGELDRQTPAGRSAEEQWQAREKAARDRLDEIRNSMRRTDSG